MTDVNKDTQAKRINRRRKITGQVVSDKMDKTIVVQTSSMMPHPDFGKVVWRRTKMKAHDEKNQAKIGDKVIIQESRPLSKDKRWVLVSVEKTADQGGSAKEVASS